MRYVPAYTGGEACGWWRVGVSACRLVFRHGGGWPGGGVAGGECSAWEALGCTLLPGTTMQPALGSQACPQPEVPSQAGGQP